MSTYFPPGWALFGALGGDLNGPETHRMSISVGLLKMIVRTALRSTTLDEESYLDNNPDLKEAWRQGHIQTLFGHWLEAGYFEGRTGTSQVVNEDWYLDMYKDVSLAIANGEIRSAKEHYVTAGEREWRIPNPEVAAEIKAWRQALLTQIAPIDESNADVKI